MWIINEVMMDRSMLMLVCLSAVVNSQNTTSVGNSNTTSTTMSTTSSTMPTTSSTLSTTSSNMSTTSSTLSTTSSNMSTTSSTLSTTSSNMSTTSSTMSTTSSNMSTTMSATSSTISTTISTTSSTSSPALSTTESTTLSTISSTPASAPSTTIPSTSTTITTTSILSTTASTPISTTLIATSTKLDTTVPPTSVLTTTINPNSPLTSPNPTAGNTCAEEILNGLTFPVTVDGQIAYSIELCPRGTANAGKSIGSAQCLNSFLTFGEHLDCDLKLESLESRVNRTLEENMFVASSVQLLISRPGQLTSQNITSAATIANSLLSSRVLNETVAVSVMATISQLMHSGTIHYSEHTNDAIRSLTKTLEDFALDMNSSSIVQPNLAVQSIKLSNWTPQVQFYALGGLSKTSPDRIGLGAGGAKTTSSSSGQSINLSLTVKLQNDSQKDWGKNNLSIGVVLYENDRFFKSDQMISQLNTSRRVVSASISDRRLLDNVEFAMTPENISGFTLSDFACVFWDYTHNDWRTDGCVKLQGAYGVQCKCNHTTNFAVLMSFKANYNYSEALNWISIVGCSLSIVGLVLTIIYQIKTRKQRGSNSTMLLANICMCMTTYYLLFIFGINNPTQKSKASVSAKNVIPASDLQQTVDQGPCTAITALLQYFLLATFAWNIMYAAHVFFLIRNALNGPPRAFRTIAVTAGWGLPAVIVGISLATTYSFKDPLGYRQEEFCWLASLNKAGGFDPKRPMLWGFLLPLAVMLCFNTSLLVYFSQTICCGNPNLKSSRSTPLKKKILSSFSLAVVLGLSWIIGYFVLITHDKTLYIILSVVFCLCNTTQGVQIFILFTLKSYLKTRTQYILDSKTESRGEP